MFFGGEEVRVTQDHRHAGTGFGLYRDTERHSVHFCFQIFLRDIKKKKKHVVVNVRCSHTFGNRVYFAAKSRICIDYYS